MSSPSRSKRRRLLILTTTTGYQTRSYVEAAKKLGLELGFGSDRCHRLPDPWQDGAIALRFEDAEDSAEKIVAYARKRRVDAIVALGDRPTPTCARACAALGLRQHPPEAADTCRDKYRSRERMREAGLSVPEFARFRVDDDPRRIFGDGAGLGFPCVLKPLALSASRGVIRADNATEAIAAFERIRRLLVSPGVRVLREDTSGFIQVERYIEGREIAIEGVVAQGRLKVLAIFDKPDPLVGPFFEETVYVTPSRLDAGKQRAVVGELERAVKALGLFHGPLHAEMRLDGERAWVMEVAARSIGGLCSRVLRFTGKGTKSPMSLEELIIRLLLGEKVGRIERERQAAAVMMIPIPAAGIYEQTLGLPEALRAPGVEEIRITAKPKHKLVPLPEGSGYLGFIFARGRTPASAEEAVREAHRRLRFVVSAVLPVLR